MTPPLEDSMNRHQFEEIVAGQVAAIEASASAPDVWIKHHSVPFRAAWEDAMRLEIHSPTNVLALHPDPLVLTLPLESVSHS